MSPFFSSWGWGGLRRSFFFGFFPLDLNVFQSSSLEVPQVLKLFLKAFSIAPQFYLIWFAQSSTVMYINWGEAMEDYNWGPKRCFHWGGVISVPKKLLMGQIWVFHQEKKLWTHTHELINMNKYPPLSMAHILCPPTPAITPGQKWWQILLEREILCSQWEGSECAHEWSSFFLFIGVVGERAIFLFFSPLSKG